MFFFSLCERSIVIIEMGETILVSNNINFYEYMLLLHASECQALNLCCPYSECLYHFNVHYIICFKDHKYLGHICFKDCNWL